MKRQGKIGGSLLIIIALVAVIGGILVKNYNRLVTLEAEVDGKYAQVENEMVKSGARYTVYLTPPQGVELKKFVVNGAEKNVDFINDSFTGVATKDVKIVVEWND